MVLNEIDRQLLAAVQDGLPLDPHPYAAIAGQIGLSEAEVIERIDALQKAAIIKRFGVVVRHHELGYRANAMVVWDVPDDQVAGIGEKLGRLDCVTLCYRRERRRPDWPYNLFCMIHGKSRESVLERIDEIVELLDLQDIPRDVLFSGRRFKQRGARNLMGDAARMTREVTHG